MIYTGLNGAQVEVEELKPCPHCGHHAYEPSKVHGQGWGQWDWQIQCSSSHCRASMTIVADGYFRQLDGELNKHIQMNELYDDRVLSLRRMWNRRVNGTPDAGGRQE